MTSSLRFVKSESMSKSIFALLGVAAKSALALAVRQCAAKALASTLRALLSFWPMATW